MAKRTAIPSAIKRLVRQQCGFGCVRCACPIYDYDHIMEVSDGGPNTAENLVLLCPVCHRDKTNGRLIKQSLIDDKEKAKDRTRTAQHSIENICYELDIGGNFVKVFHGGVLFEITSFGAMAIRFAPEPLLTGYILNPDGSTAIAILDGQFALGANTWDIEYVGKTLTFRSKLRNIFAKITIDPQQRIISLRGKIEYHKVGTVDISDSGILANSTPLAYQNYIEECGLGLAITDKKIKLPITVSGDLVVDNVFRSIQGIAIGNTRFSTGNKLQKCDLGLAWDLPYLKSLTRR